MEDNVINNAGMLTGIVSMHDEIPDSYYRISFDDGTPMNITGNCSLTVNELGTGFRKTGRYHQPICNDNQIRILQSYMNTLHDDDIITFKAMNKLINNAIDSHNSSFRRAVFKIKHNKNSQSYNAKEYLNVIINASIMINNENNIYYKNKTINNNGILKVENLNQNRISIETIYDEHMKNINNSRKLYSVPLIRIATIIACDNDEQLPVGPYAFGAWLGDGLSYNASRICGVDNEVRDNVIKDGYMLRKTYHDNRTNVRTWVFNDLNNDIMNAGLHYDSHGNSSKLIKDVPHMFLTASESDRIRFLAGILDTDGTINKNGVISLSMTTYDVIMKTRIIVCSLGLKPSCIRVKHPHYKHDDVIIKCKDAYEFSFIPHLALSDYQLFNVKRKKTRLDNRIKSMLSGSLKQQSRNHQRYLTSIDRISNVKNDVFKCLTINDGDGILISESLIPVCA